MRDDRGEQSPHEVGFRVHAAMLMRLCVRRAFIAEAFVSDDLRRLANMVASKLSENPTGDIDGRGLNGNRAISRRVPIRVDASSLQERPPWRKVDGTVLAGE